MCACSQSLYLRCDLTRDLGNSAVLSFASPRSALRDYWRGLYVCLVLGRPYEALRSALPSLAPAARLQIYSLCLHLRLWHSPHYRSGTLRQDLRKNLRNVALPGSGLPLSALCVARPVAWLFAWLGVPLVAAFAAYLRTRPRARASGAARPGFGRAFGEALLQPGDWFSYWRLNCVLASYHALRTADPGYELEDKLAFLAACEDEGVAASPHERMPKLIVKHRNEEGGLGLHVYRNAACGGDWIIQRAYDNHESVARLLPAIAPLSTLRLVTSSRACMRRRPREELEAEDVSILSACFRAGRLHAETDHKCVMYDLDVRR